MTIAFKPTLGLNAFAFQYVNFQCQHDSLSIKLAAKLQPFAETAKFLADFFKTFFLMHIFIDKSRHEKSLTGSEKNSTNEVTDCGSKYHSASTSRIIFPIEKSKKKLHR